MKVFQTSPFLVESEKILKPDNITVEIGNGKHTHDELLLKTKDAIGIISLLRDKIDKELIDNASNLKIISNYAVGFDNIDIKYAKSKGIFVSNTPDVLTETTADLTFALLLSTARRISESDRYVRAGNFKGWSPFEMLGVDVYKKRIGIFGFGRIGRSVAKRAVGFNMEIVYSDPTDYNVDYAKHVTFEELVKTSDFISINAPFVKELEHKFNEEIFRKMKKNAVIVNSARGKIINEDDLASALENGTIRGAGLDVYEFEPEINERLKKLENVILAPHIGSATEETRVAMAMICLKSIREVLVENRRPDICVNC